MRIWNFVRLDSVQKRAAFSLAAACFYVSTALAEGRPPYRPMVHDRAPYWRRYMGPPTSYGSPYYRLLAPRYFPPPYIGYGYGGYGYGGYGYGSAAGYAYPGSAGGVGTTGPAPWY